jgi:hypothetical protein
MAGRWAPWVVAAVLSTGCVGAPRAIHTVGAVAAATLWSAAVIGTVVVLEDHDAHRHGAACGHYRRWHDDRWIYKYDDRWEYYDAPTARWYVYVDAGPVVAGR